MEKLYTAVQGTLIGVATSVAAYFDSTFSFVCALILAFLFNILAGFKADEVKINIKRIFPPDIFDNFNGNKLKDSLMELFLITTTRDTKCYGSISVWEIVDTHSETSELITCSFKMISITYKNRIMDIISYIVGIP